MPRGLLVATLTGAVFAAGAIAAASPAPGAVDCTVTWAGPADSTWATAANWSPARVPTSTDTVCVSDGAAPRIRVTGSTAVAGLVPGAATVQVALGVTLDTGALTLAGGRLAGPGTVRVATDDGVAASIGPAVLANRAHLELVQGQNSGSMLSGRVALSGGSTLTVSGGSLQLQPGEVDDIDDDALNRMSLRNVRATATAVDADGAGDVRIGVPLDLAASTLAVQSTASVQLDRSVQLAADGTFGRTDNKTFAIAVDGSLVLPRTVTALVGRANLDITGSARVVSADGTDVLSTLTRVDGGAVEFGGSHTFERALVVTGAASSFYLAPGADLRVPSMTMTDGRFANSGTITVGASGRVTLDHTRAFVGSINGLLRSVGSELERVPVGVRALSLDQTSVVDQCTTNRICRTAAVTGDAKLAGTLDFAFTSRARIGDQFVVMRVGGTLTGAFEHVTGNAVPVTVTYEPATYAGAPVTDVVVTVTGSGREPPSSSGSVPDSEHLTGLHAGKRLHECACDD